MAEEPRVAPTAPPLGMIASVSVPSTGIPPPINPWPVSRILGPHDHASTSSPEPAAKRRRTVPCADGCTWCRKKKIKCSGKPQESGPCSNCSRDGLVCSFVTGPGRVSRVTPSQDVTEAGTPRKRAQRACRECHAHKTKCSGSLPFCARCTNLGVECIYEPSKRKFSSAPGSGPALHAKNSRNRLALPESLQGTTSMEAKQLISPTTSSLSPGPSAPTIGASATNFLSAEDLLAQKDTLTRHFQLWFKLFGRLPLLSILYPQSTFLEIEEKRLDPILGRIVCAITARIICPGSRSLPEFAEKCTEQVDYHILQNISTCLRGDGRHNLTILLIAICHNWLEFQVGKVWMYMSLAGRLITALQLNSMGAGETPIEQEITRRMVWAVWNIDRFLAGGFEEHLVLRDEYMRIKPPTMDISFPGENNDGMAAALPGTPANDTQRQPLGVYHIDLQRVRHCILSFTKQLPIQPNPDKPGAALEASDVISRITSLQKTLSHFNANLPSYFKVSGASLERWVNLPESGSFIMLWTNFWGLYIELYLFSIPGLREKANPELTRQLPITFVVKSQKQAVAYAITLSQFWRSVQDIVAKRLVVDGTERLYTIDQTLIINVIQSTKVLLAAREHRLYHGVQEDSTAPLIPQEPVTDEFLEELIQSNMGLFKQFEHYYPVTIERLTSDLRTAVNNFKMGSLPRQCHESVSISGRRPTEDTRLPGPHSMLESADAVAHNDERDTQFNLSAAEQYMRQRKEQNSGDLVITPTFTTANEASLNYIPRIPAWLNHARAQEIPPGVPALPEGNIPSGLCFTEFAVPASQLNPGPGPRLGAPVLAHYQFDNALELYSTPAQNPVMSNSFSSMPMHYEYARDGGRSTRFSFLPEYDHYERAAGKRLPFPDISNLLRNENKPFI